MLFGREKSTSKMLWFILVKICVSLLALQFGVVYTTMHLFVNKEEALFCHELGKLTQVSDLRYAKWYSPIR